MITIEETTDGYIVVGFPESLPTNQAILVFDDDYRVVLDYADRLTSDSTWDTTRILGESLKADFRAYAAALPALISFFREAGSIDKLILGDLPHDGRDWKALFDGALGHLSGNEPLYLIDCADESGRRGRGEQTLRLDGGRTILEEAVKVLMERHTPISQFAFFTAGVNLALIPSLFRLESVAVVSKERSTFQEKLTRWLTIARREIDPSYFDLYTGDGGRTFLADPETAVEYLDSRPVKSFLAELAARDFFGTWLWLGSLAGDSTCPKHVVKDAYACCKAFLHSGVPQTDSNNTFTYAALRALVFGLPFAMTRERPLSRRTEIQIDEDKNRAAVDREGQTISARDERPEQLLSLADGCSFQEFAKTIFHFVDSVADEYPTAVLGLQLVSPDAGEAGLLVTIRPPLPVKVFHGADNSGRVRLAWRALEQLVRSKATEPKAGDGASHIRLAFPPLPE